MNNDHQQQTPARLDPRLPLSLVLGAGGVRGMAHVGVLDALVARGFRITEIVGASVGALILAFYAGVGMDVPTLRTFGINLTSRHLLAWAWLRRAPDALRKRFEHRAGIIPGSLEQLAAVSGGRLHHGVERIGVVAYDLVAREEVFFHNLQADFALDDATRGAVAIPYVYPPRECTVSGRRLRLVDGGLSNLLPVDYLFAPPFCSQQVLAVDVSNRARQRQANLAKVEALSRAHPDISITVLQPDTLGRATLVYRRAELQSLIDSGRRAADLALGESKIL
ncbi:MAG: patatin-like phospholipase family protein [Blastocatellia bacterium]